MGKRNGKRAVLIFLMLLVGMVMFAGCKAEEPVGIKKAYINDDGELVLVYTDGERDNLGTVVGKDGEDGKDGHDGSDGKDGADGKDGEDGKDGLDGEKGADGTVTVINSGSNIAEATSKGLQSAVSIVCQDISSAGSGVIYKLDKETGSAFIITNHHVVYDVDKRSRNGISEKITVYLYGSEMDGFEIPAEYVGGSMQYDIAVLYIKESERLKASCMVPATIADSDKTVVGEAAIAIGNAKGAGTSACYGVVSVASEYLTMLAVDNKTTVTYRVLRVDTAVNSGNSGGGLYNEAGELMGIVNAKIMDSTVENIGYAIPSNVAVSVAENLIDYCFGTELESVQRGMLGITVASIDSRAVREEETGNIYIYETVEVQEVLDGSLVKGLILPGDRLKSITSLGKTVTILRRHHVVDAMLDARIGDEISVCLIRDGKEVTVKVTMTKEHVTEY